MRLYSFKLLAEWTWQGCWLVALGYLKLISWDLVTNWNLLEFTHESKSQLIKSKYSDTATSTLKVPMLDIISF